MMFKESCPGSKEISSPYPEEIKCFWCDTLCEIWSDEIEIICKGCGRKISRNMKPTCIQWCPSAKECIGEKKYKELIKHLEKDR